MADRDTTDDDTVALLTMAQRHDEEVRRIGADFSAERIVDATDPSDVGWVVVAVDRLLNLRPAVRAVYGPFAGHPEADEYADRIEENGTQLFVVRVARSEGFPRVD